MPTLSIEFLNCNNLLGIGTSGPAPQQKIADLASMLGSSSTAASAFICLCEVANPNLGQAVALTAFPNAAYGPVWSHSGKLRGKETGLLILYDKSILDHHATVRDRALRNVGERSRWLAAKFRIKTSPQEPLWLIVNHWHSGFQDAYDGEYNRRRMSNEISNLFRGTASLKGRRTSPILDQKFDKIVILGDFNCDPADRVFRLEEQGAWKVSPDMNAVINGTAKWPCFYNPIVKAPNIFGTFESHKYGLSSPMVDHILVSGTLCGQAGLRYRVDSIVRSQFSRASDHAAIGAALDY